MAHPHAFSFAMVLAPIVGYLLLHTLDLDLLFDGEFAICWGLELPFFVGPVAWC